MILKNILLYLLARTSLVQEALGLYYFRRKHHLLLHFAQNVPYLDEYPL